MRAFRFVHSAGGTPSFLPVAYLPGCRQPPTCQHYSLSFFETLEDARKRYLSLADRADAVSRYGTHIGEVELTEVDGVASAPRGPHRHFDLHEFEEASFEDRVLEYHAP
jgi:hypothetical protein